jgi:methylmalonyl-CoA epimerase
MSPSVGHIGLAVKDIDKFLERFCCAFAIPIPKIIDVENRQMKVAMLDLKNIQIEVLEDYSQDGEIATYVKNKGDGIHHFCIISDDIQRNIDALSGLGFQLKNCIAKQGLRGKKISFISPEEFGGINVELSEP